MNLSQYNSITLYDEEAEALFKVENVMREVIPDIKHNSMATFGLIERGNHVVDLRLFRSFFFPEFKIKTLPDEIGNLCELESLDLSHNLLRTLPDSIVKLEELQQLYLDFNQFKIFPDQICELPYLRKLNFDDNKLDYIPEEFTSLGYLQSMHIAGNRFLNIPKQFADLRYLRRLDISRNYISKLGYDEILNLVHIYFLDLRGNHIPINEDRRLRSFLRMNGIQRPKFQLTGDLNALEHPFSSRNISNKIKSEPKGSIEDYNEDDLIRLYLSQYT